MTVEPVAVVRSTRRAIDDDHWGGVEATDGTPVLDIKPVMAEFLPREPVRQPAWSTELMADYW
jgi:tRNA (Thr-GGU) A37 N-methylase